MIGKENFREFCASLLAEDPPREGAYKEYTVPCGGRCCGWSIRTSMDRVRAFATGADEQPLCSWCSEHDGKGRGLVEWERACPRIFREGGNAETITDERRFPPEAWRQLRAWTFADGLDGVRSLYIAGDTGVCKSRMMFELVRRAVVRNGRTLRIFRGGEFKKEIHSRFGNADFGASFKYVDELLRIDLVVFDEFAQEQFSPSTFEALWRLVDARLGEGSPTFFLSNVSPTRLARFFDPKGENFAAESLQRRIVELCRLVSVDEPPAPPPLR